MRTLISITLIGLLAACGFKGALYLPEGSTPGPTFGSKPAAQTGTSSATVPTPVAASDTTPAP
ncbi:LPS translocon maturation chaperone LptM [Chitinibacteraceae bacterium HSL-7]